MPPPPHGGTLTDAQTWAKINPYATKAIKDALASAVLTGITVALPPNVAYLNVEQSFTARQGFSTSSSAVSGNYVSTVGIQTGIGGLAGASSAQFYGANIGVNVYETTQNITGGAGGIDGYVYLGGPITLASGIAIGATVLLSAAGTFTVSHGIYVNTEASAAGTFADHHGLTIANIFNPGGATVTKFAGVVVPDLTATNASNLVLGAAGAPTGTFSIYNASVRDNYFGGSLQLGGYDSARPVKFYSEVVHTTTGATSAYGYWSNVQASPASNSAAFFRGIASFVSLTTNVNFTGNTTGILSSVDYTGSGVFSNIRALDLTTTLSGSGTASIAIGGSTTVVNSSNGTITEARGFQTSIGNTGTGTITDGYGIKFGTSTNSGGGTFTNLAGIAMADMAVGTNRTNLLLGTVTIPAGLFNIYAPSTLRNYFAGFVGIGVIPSETSGIMLEVASANTTETGLDISNTSTGGKDWRLRTIGSAIAARLGNFSIRNDTDALNTVEISPTGNFGVGSSTFPSGGGTPVIVIAQASGNPTGMPSNTAGHFAKDVAGTCEMFSIDEAGNVTQNSSHVDPDFAESLGINIDNNDPYPRIGYDANIYLGKEAYTYVSPTSGRQQRITRNLPPEQVQDWNTVHNAHKARRDSEIAGYNALTAREKLDYGPAPRPYVMKPEPAWIAARRSLPAQAQLSDNGGR